MDFVKKAIHKVKGDDKHQQSQQSQQSQPSQPSQPSTGQAPGGDQPDYVDKGVESAAKGLGHPIDRSTEERMTDQGREAYEKATGNKVNPKISN